MQTYHGETPQYQPLQEHGQFQYIPESPTSKELTELMHGIAELAQTNATHTESSTYSSNVDPSTVEVIDPTHSSRLTLAATKELGFDDWDFVQFTTATDIPSSEVDGKTVKRGAPVIHGNLKPGEVQISWVKLQDYKGDPHKGHQSVNLRIAPDAQGNFGQLQWWQDYSTNAGKFYDEKKLTAPVNARTNANDSAEFEYPNGIDKHSFDRLFSVVTACQEDPSILVPMPKSLPQAYGSKVAGFASAKELAVKDPSYKQLVEEYRKLRQKTTASKLASLLSRNR